MSKKLLGLGLLILTSYSGSSFAQTRQQLQAEREAATLQSAAAAASSDDSERRVYDEGQVQLPSEGQVENVPEGHVEAVNPIAVQPPTEDTQPDLFRFESRLFNPIPSD